MNEFAKIPGTAATVVYYCLVDQLTNVSHAASGAKIYTHVIMLH